jgi:hypothetical protein
MKKIRSVSLLCLALVAGACATVSTKDKLAKVQQDCNKRGPVPNCATSFISTQKGAEVTEIARLLVAPDPSKKSELCMKELTTAELNDPASIVVPTREKPRLPGWDCGGAKKGPAKKSKKDSSKEDDINARIKACVAGDNSQFQSCVDKIRAESVGK